MPLNSVQHIRYENDLFEDEMTVSCMKLHILFDGGNLVFVQLAFIVHLHLLLAIYNIQYRQLVIIQIWYSRKWDISMV